jgi:hypothetical protein
MEQLQLKRKRRKKKKEVEEENEEKLIKTSLPAKETFLSITSPPIFPKSTYKKVESRFSVLKTISPSYLPQQVEEVKIKKSVYKHNPLLFEVANLLPPSKFLETPTEIKIQTGKFFKKKESFKINELIYPQKFRIFDVPINLSKKEYIKVASKFDIKESLTKERERIKRESVTMLENEIYQLGSLGGGKGGFPEEELDKNNPFNFDSKFWVGASNRTPIIFFHTCSPIALTYFLREVYREITGKFPEIVFRAVGVNLPHSIPSLPSKEGELEKSKTIATSEAQLDFEVKETLEDIKIAKRIEVVWFKDSVEINNFWNVIQSKLKHSLLDELGFLILVGKKAVICQPYANVFRLILPFEEGKEIKREEFYISSADSHFLSLLQGREKLLERFVSIYNTFIKRDVEAGEIGDVEQYKYKVCVARYILTEYFGLKNLEEFINFFKSELKSSDKQNFDTEKAIGTSGKRCDIWFKKEGKEYWIEIETFIGTGEPLKKIDEDVEKYKEAEKLSEGSELWIVIRPEDAVIHLKGIKRKHEVYKKIYGDSVKIKVIGWKKLQPTLIDFSEFVNKLRDVIKEIDENKYKEYISMALGFL